MSAQTIRKWSPVCQKPYNVYAIEHIWKAQEVTDNADSKINNFEIDNKF